MKVRPAFKILPDGREICLKTPEGRGEYRRRKIEMWKRQDGLCGLCGEYLPENQITFEHVDGRGMGGAHRDDRIWIPKGDTVVPYNMAACVECNNSKGSKRISSLAAFRIRNPRTGP